MRDGDGGGEAARGEPGIRFEEFSLALQSHPRIAALLLRPPSVIEDEVRLIIGKRVPRIRDVSHVVVHIGVYGAKAEIQIVTDKHLTVDEVNGLGAEARGWLLHECAGLTEVDMHLELDDVGWGTN